MNCLVDITSLLSHLSADDERADNRNPRASRLSLLVSDLQSLTDTLLNEVSQPVSVTCSENDRNWVILFLFSHPISLSLVFPLLSIAHFSSPPPLFPRRHLARQHSSLSVDIDGISQVCNSCDKHFLFIPLSTHSHTHSVSINKHSRQS